MKLQNMNYCLYFLHKIDLINVLENNKINCKRAANLSNNLRKNIRIDILYNLKVRV